ncbi:acetate kinase [Chitiniphilus shinanonensis]|uniref:Acetate kinase n=1 Tax=Chitiniphilus shinanonensis TaxID=553088 RepID=A0ABQ6BNE2_9NEIS|nr:acetate/propionate family kinase [Chitiniphilus shinanonensis]GLS02982.1 acetate kinase [Chitiniphilus shinanonensis]
MKQLILVINAGSSSIKFSLFEQGEADPVLLYKGQVEGIYVDPYFTAKSADGEKLAAENLPADAPKSHDQALRHILKWLEGHTAGRKLAVIGHRVVHGGRRFSRPEVVTHEIIAELEALVPLAPLHAPHNITPIRILAELLPGVPQVVCFDTAFHANQPEINQLYALPYDFSQREGIRRYGFHGLSYEYIAAVLPEIDQQAAAGRTVVAHLGNGASMAALSACHGIASTMGFTALEGLPMGTRTGSIDAGVILHLLNHLHMDAKGIEDLLYKKSGLLGLSGISSDMRELHASDDPRAKLAVDYFVSKIAREGASLAVTLGGIDALVFTAGIGENDDIVRRDVCQQLGWLGVELDDSLNAQRSGQPRRISTSQSKVAVYVVPTNEELMIARHSLGCIGEDKAVPAATPTPA